MMLGTLIFRGASLYSVAVVEMFGIPWFWIGVKSASKKQKINQFNFLQH